MEYEVTHNADRRRFEARLDGYTGHLEYVVVNGALNLIHTIVPEEIEGRGVAASLVKTTLLYARANDMKIIPSCPYVAVYIKRHPEYESLIQH